MNLNTYLSAIRKREKLKSNREPPPLPFKAHFPFRKKSGSIIGPLTNYASPRLGRLHLPPLLFIVSLNNQFPASNKKHGNRIAIARGVQTRDRIIQRVSRYTPDTFYRLENRDLHLHPPLTNFGSVIIRNP